MDMRLEALARAALDAEVRRAGSEEASPVGVVIDHQQQVDPVAVLAHGVGLHGGYATAPAANCPRSWTGREPLH